MKTPKKTKGRKAKTTKAAKPVWMFHSDVTREDVAHAYRVEQAKKLLARFEFAKGRPARSVEELAEWVRREDGKPKDK